MTNVTLFSQIISKLDRLAFNKIVRTRQTDKHNKGFNSWTHMVSMLFSQFAKSQSVRDISNGLRSATGNLNHMGIQKPHQIYHQLSEPKTGLGAFQRLLLCATKFFRTADDLSV